MMRLHAAVELQCDNCLCVSCIEQIKMQMPELLMFDALTAR